MLKVEFRSGNEMTIEGYVNAVCRDSRVLHNEKGEFVEQVRPNVFSNAIKKATNIELRYNHDKIIGNTENGTLTLFEDNIGLYAKAIINDYILIEKAKNGGLSGWSFSFIVLDEDWLENDGLIKRRYLNEIELKEVSILDITPAYFATSINNVEIRNLETKSEEIEIRFLKDENKEQSLIKKVEIDILSVGGKL